MIFDYYETGLIGTLTLAADERGLRHIGFATSRAPLRILPDWQRRPDFFAETKAQLASYFRGERQDFDLPLAPHGSAFQMAVWQALRKIPYGSVTTYRWVAEQVGNPQATRAVGAANGKNPLPIVIPCHRVIGSNGTLTGFGGGLEVKQQLIALEERRHVGMI
jgi:methylated-DNA-[protein]-cysteine S-methyltransferase